MFGFLKRLLGQRAAAATKTSSPAVPAVIEPTRPVQEEIAKRNGAGVVNGAHNRHLETAAVKLPLQPILTGLPAELHSLVIQTQVGALTIALPLERVLPRLSRGVVKITFGELRQGAPQVFAPNKERDQVEIVVPMGLVLPQINPALLSCRRVRRKVEVPEDIHSPFDLQGNGLSFSVEPAKPESAPAASRPVGPPATPQLPPIPCPALASAGSIPPGRHTVLSAPTPQPPAGLPMASPHLAPAARLHREVGPAEASPPIAPAPIPMLKPAVAPAPRSAPAVPPAPALPANRPPATPVAPTAPSRPAPTLAPAPVSARAAGDPGSKLAVGLSLLATGWPEAVRKEIAQLRLGDARVALPNDAMEASLKQGRIAYSWQTVRSWITPPLAPVASAHDQVVLELPLKIIAPLFLVRLRESTKLQRRLVVDANIPNLFFGLPQPESSPTAEVASVAASKTSDTNFYAREQVVSASPGTKFVSKLATPNEVVSRAAALDGVAGALIALPDGLLVASRLAPDLNADTLAAFLPQIFNKVSQSTKELRMGDLNNLNFTVGEVPWKIFRVNAIFFAAFGRTGGPLPTAQLAALAAELDHRPK